MLNRFERFMRDESGLEIMEWAFVGGVITVIGVGLFFAIGQDSFGGLSALGTETSLIPNP